MTITLPDQEKPTLKKITFQVTTHQHSRVHAVAKTTNVSFAQLMRHLLDYSLFMYLEQKGMFVCGHCERVQPASQKHLVNVDSDVLAVGECCYAAEQYKKGTFNCQACGMQCSTKKKHPINVVNEVFVFGDCCYFSGAYKDVVRRFI